jgi:hypothetical protein
MADLHERNPTAATLQVHCRPWKIPDHVKLFAARSSGEHVHTDERPDELRDFAEQAGVFIEVDVSAPKENARKMASEYGLICQQDLAVQSTPLESLRSREPCSKQANAAGNANYLGTADPQPCNPGAGGPTNGATGSKAASLPRIGVCTHPEGISSDEKEWYGGKGITADVKTKAEHKAQIAKATVVFFIDKSAPPESIWYFGPNVKARCPGKPPIPYKDWVAKNEGAGTQQSGTQQSGSGTSGAGKQPSGSGTSGTGTAGTNRKTTPKTGSSPPSSSSSPTGTGPQLSVFEQIARGLSLAGALAQGDTSGNAKDPNGHRNGSPTGKNVGGFSFPLLQAGVGAFHLFSAAGVKPKDFIDIVNAASKKGQRGLIEKADKEGLELADKLIKENQLFPMAKGLQEMQTVMPFEMASKFTQGLGNKFQAHKIFERQALKKWKGSDAGFEKLPSVVLTEAEHREVTRLLDVEWQKLLKRKGKGELVTTDELRDLYKKAYVDYPHWLEIIEKQLR